MKPLVTVCIPTYNSALTLGETLESILAQSYVNLEIWVVDNASTDQTIKIAKTYKDKRIKIHINQQNIGAEGNFNTCIGLANGKYTAIYHADDIYTPEMVCEQVDFLEKNPDVGGVLTEAHVIDEHGSVKSAIRFPSGLVSDEVNKIEFTQLFKALLRHSNFLVCPSAMVQTYLYKNEIKGWRGELFASSADLDIWIRIALRSKLGLISKKLMKYRVCDSQYSAKVRGQTVRADFFRVIDYYIDQDDVRKLLSPIDLANYQRLIRRDDVMRATNLMLIGNFNESARVLDRFFRLDVLVAAIQNKRGLFVLLLYMYIKTINRAAFRPIGVKGLKIVKKVMNR